MLITVPNSSRYAGLKEKDLIALTRNDTFIGYAEIFSITSGNIILDVDNSVGKIFNELIGENIPFDFDIRL